MRHSYNLDIFKKEENDFYYLLGAFMTDGCIYQPKHSPNSRVISLVSKDLDWLELINQLICPNKKIIKSGKNCFMLQYTNQEMGNILISKGCIPQKSLIMTFPEIPEKFLPDFIRGCWDGDGSISVTHNKLKTHHISKANFTSGSKTFAENLSIILQDRGIKNTLYCRVMPHRIIEDRLVTSSTKNYRIQLSSTQSTYNFVKYVYYDGHHLSMPRKKNNANLITSNWEAPIYCTDCKTILHNNRKTKRCHDCKSKHLKEYWKKRHHNSKLNERST